MLYFTPKYVKQESDLNYGEVVTHENYNAKLNLNTTQGDYNTDVLRILFSSEDIENTYRIPYLEKYIDDSVDVLKTTVDEHDKQIKTNTEAINSHTKDISDIITGAKKVGKALYADAITGVDEAANHTYYGKDYSGSIGFYAVPDGIFAEDISSGSADIDGIYYVPRVDSVAESMLTPAVRTKLNRVSITRYPELSELPSINNIQLIGNKTLTELGIQPAGSYLTSVPDDYITAATIAETYLSKADAESNYAALESYNTLSTNVDNLEEKVNTLPYNRVFIGSTSGALKVGDLLVDL